MTKVLDFIEKALMVIVGLLMIIMVAVVFMQVVLRYGFKASTTWADEIARYCMIWTVFLACPVGYRRHCHIKVDVLTRKFTPGFRRIMEFLMYLLQVVFLGVLLAASRQYLAKIGRQLSQTLKVDMRLVFLGVVIGAVLMIVFILEAMYKDCVLVWAGKKGKET